MLLLVDLEVHVLAQLAGDAVGPGVALDVVVGGAGDDQRRPRLVDEDVVHLVDDGEVQRPLHLLLALVVIVVALGRRPHVVAEIIEAELVVRAVGDVAHVGLLPLVGVHVALDRADRQAQGKIQRAHPFHVAAGQVVVDRDHVHALALQGVEVGRQRGHEGLAFAGDHFGDVAAVQDHAAHELHVEVPHAQVRGGRPRGTRQRPRPAGRPASRRRPAVCGIWPSAPSVRRRSRPGSGVPRP